MHSTLSPFPLPGLSPLSPFGLSALPAPEPTPGQQLLAAMHRMMELSEQEQRRREAAQRLGFEASGSLGASLARFAVQQVLESLDRQEHMERMERMAAMGLGMLPGTSPETLQAMGLLDASGPTFPGPTDPAPVMHCRVHRPTINIHVHVHR